MDSPARLCASTSCISWAIRLRSSRAAASCRDARDASTSASSATARSRSAWSAACSIERSASSHTPTADSRPATLPKITMTATPKPTASSATQALRTGPAGMHIGSTAAAASTGTSPSPAGTRAMMAKPVPMVSATPNQVSGVGRARALSTIPNSAHSPSTPTTTFSAVPSAAITETTTQATSAPAPITSPRSNIRRRPGPAADRTTPGHILTIPRAPFPIGTPTTTHTRPPAHGGEHIRGVDTGRLPLPVLKDLAKGADPDLMLVSSGGTHLVGRRQTGDAIRGRNRWSRSAPVDVRRRRPAPLSAAGTT